MRYWRFLAYDAVIKTHSGVARGVTPGPVVLALQQRGLRVIDMVEIDIQQYRMARSLASKLRALRNVVPLRPTAPAGWRDGPATGRRGRPWLLAAILAILAIGICIGAMYGQ